MSIIYKPRCIIDLGLSIMDPPVLMMVATVSRMVGVTLMMETSPSIMDGVTLMLAQPELAISQRDAHVVCLGTSSQDLGSQM